MRIHLKSLLDKFAAVKKLPRKAFRESLDGFSLSEALRSLPSRERTDPVSVFAIAYPIMDKLSEGESDIPQKADWLEAIYDYLTEQIYPIEGKAPRSEGFILAADFYLHLLRAVIEAEDCPFDPMTDLSLLRPEEEEKSRVEKEYRRFLQLIREEYFLELLRLGRAVKPFDTASHIIGVQHLALHMARQAAAAGIPVDLPLVFAAALSHDMGKFGCRGQNALRVPYLHYYYTFEWLDRNHLHEIAHVAANHSTWDLEFENLPIESLLLIYADFRVRGERDAHGKEHMRIYSLSEAYDAIFKKLADMTEEKQHRYKMVYLKLRDFEQYLMDHGVNPDPFSKEALPGATMDAALLRPADSLKALKSLVFDNNIRLMDSITGSDSFGALLEAARDEKNLQRIRTYLQLFEEYSTYMTRKNKLLSLGFLYELLMHQDGDVRRTAARIMGKLLANSGPRYRKELPFDAPVEAMPPTMHDILRESDGLWEQYIEACLHPDHKISPKHAQRINNSLKILTESLFSHCLPEEKSRYFLPLYHRLERFSPEDRFYLLDSLLHVPSDVPSEEQFPALLASFETALSDPQPRVRIGSLRCLHLYAQLPLCRTAIAEILEKFSPQEELAFVYQCNRVRKLCDLSPLPLPDNSISEIFLANLKASLHWTIKIIHIDYLCEYAVTHPEQAFHIATHFSNLLSVSEHLPVREYAGQGIVEVAPCLSIAQSNDLVVDLVREVETGQSVISSYIPPYLGALLDRLPEKERDESVLYLEDLIRGANTQAARTSLHAVGVMLSKRLEQEKAESADWKMLEYLFGLLLTGTAHYKESVHLSALTVLCKNIFGASGIPLSLRRACFSRVGKKLHTLLTESKQDQLVFFHQSAILNHLYRFLCQAEVESKDPDAVQGFSFPATRPAAFFPGTFDPFSAGHKRIVEEIRHAGFEVYLSVDEFSWSKRTLPKLLRRKIVSMSVSNLWDVYLFPDDIPINIAIAQDLQLLRDLFGEREMYLVAGSDVIFHASAYKSEDTDSARYYNHVIFPRVDAREDAHSSRQRIQEIIRGKLQFLSLPPYYEAASSTQIREYIDKDLDIAMLVDPVVQGFIYDKGLYLRTPQYKMELEEIGRRLSCERLMSGYRAIFREGDTCLGQAEGHTVSISGLYEALGDMHEAEQVRLCTSGKILFVDESFIRPQNGDGEEILLPLLNELLARSLNEDHTYALFRTEKAGSIAAILPQMGFLPVPGTENLYYSDMRSPMVVVMDAFERIKPPLRNDPAVVESILATRPRLRLSLADLFPGKLLLSFNTELLNAGLLEKVAACNEVSPIPQKIRQLGRCMCVPYGKILSGMTVPNTVTKALHVDKRFSADISGFSIVEYPGYSPLKTQIRTLKSFRRPVLLVDDLLHNGYRLEKLLPLFREEGVQIERILVGVLSGRGRDLMEKTGRKVEYEHFIPNLHYWFNESLLYPFLGGDSLESGSQSASYLSSINLILPYRYPYYIRGASRESVLRLSRISLENARSIFLSLERRYQLLFNTSLSLKRLGEVLFRPRLPDKGQYLLYDPRIAASSYLEDDLQLLRRIAKEEK